jgi:NAD-specific glutamate dehydrogenase
VQEWRDQHADAAAHARSIVDDIRAQPGLVDFASISVALQAVRRLAATAR